MQLDEIFTFYYPKPKLRQFFSYFGGKWRLAPKYPVPVEETIIEPFCGSAGYSVRHYERNVILNDINPIIYGLWKYLISVKSSEIRRIPIDILHVDQIKGFPQEVKWLVGFWFHIANAQPGLQISPWMQWREEKREYIANQVEHIRHWKVSNKSYHELSNIQATWFIDPPYSKVNFRKYRYNNLNYKELGQWCLDRQGQIIVCEQKGAEWLPFEPFVEQGNLLGKIIKEVIYARPSDGY